MVVDESISRFKKVCPIDHVLQLSCSEQTQRFSAVMKAGWLRVQAYAEAVPCIAIYMRGETFHKIRRVRY